GEPGAGRALPLRRLVQEALSNAMRHSGAKLLEVRMAVDHAACRVVIEDDGVGLPADRPRAGHGLENMRRRAHALGGEARIDSGPHGTTVAVHFPRPRDDPARSAGGRRRHASWSPGY